ncbi:MAG: flavodoxin family protein [Desulfobulbaceae bacterium]|nr:flavodoxin family protein [Desulfobulbaceae bacterium]MDH3541326.1 flavodoxin family protein [Desulfobulbaceae bacterium]MDH3782983.1 flavodoxin family protein [Desulfobulbaceae bacterium]HKJ14118.1 flavodoxin family protein [Desulfobulbales bacterium]
MDVLAFLGSPRKKGNSEVLTQELLEGVRQAGGSPEIIRLCDLKISPCISCGGCDKTGRCVVEDDMIPLYEKIISIDKIIVSSPIFFYGVTAQTKAFIDRTQALWNRKRLLQKKGEWVDNPERKGFFISVAATRGARIFEGAILTMKYGYDAMGMQYGGDFLVTGPDKRGDMAKYEKKLAEAREAGKNFILGLDAHVD